MALAGKRGCAQASKKCKSLWTISRKKPLIEIYVAKTFSSSACFKESEADLLFTKKKNLAACIWSGKQQVGTLTPQVADGHLGGLVSSLDLDHHHDLLHPSSLEKDPRILKRLIHYLHTQWHLGEKEGPREKLLNNLFMPRDSVGMVMKLTIREQRELLLSKGRKNLWKGAFDLRLFSGLLPSLLILIIRLFSNKWDWKKWPEWRSLAA